MKASILVAALRCGPVHEGRSDVRSMGGRDESGFRGQDRASKDKEEGEGSAFNGLGGRLGKICVAERPRWRQRAMTIRCGWCNCRPDPISLIDRTVRFTTREASASFSNASFKVCMTESPCCPRHRYRFSSEIVGSWLLDGIDDHNLDAVLPHRHTGPTLRSILCSPSTANVLR